MNAKNTGFTIIVAILFICSAMLFRQHILSSHIIGDREDTEHAVEVEPDIGAAQTLNTYIRNIQSTPLSYGALVGGDSERFIQLSTDGEIFASGEISGQSQYSYVGDVNYDRLSGNPEFQIRPGRLSFYVANLTRLAKVKVEFFPGELGTGVSLSYLDFDIGPYTHNHLLHLPYTAANQIEFQATEALSTAKVDIAFGGRLTLDQNIKGKVDASLPIRISIENPSHSVVATLYQHIKFNGNRAGAIWELTELRTYSTSELKSRGFNDIISSFVIADGFQLTACSNDNLNGNCKTFNRNNLDLRRIRVNGSRFNDVISSFQISRVN